MAAVWCFIDVWVIMSVLKLLIKMLINKYVYIDNKAGSFSMIKMTEKKSPKRKGKIMTVNIHDLPIKKSCKPIDYVHEGFQLS